MKHQWGILAVRKDMRKRVRKVISLTTIKKMRRPTELIINTEAYIMTAAEMEGVYGISIDTICIKIRSNKCSTQ